VRTFSKLRALTCCVVILSLAAIAVPSGQEAARETGQHAVLDELLDLYVRGGFVYYRALKVERGKLDRYINQLGAANAGSLSRDGQIAFWLNAYNALVLRTVVDHYPIQGQSANYPPHSLRQVPGAFDRLPHHVAGRSLTLDDIEQKILPEFHDPRVYLALGRGAVGSGRLRSEAFVPERLETQLSEVAAECATRFVCVHIDRGKKTVAVSPIFSWREKEFSPAYAGSAAVAFASRSPIERAVLAFVEPRLLATEREFLAQNAFRVEFAPFDWSLNDLTGRGGR
jgi:hypothetical protein